MAAILGIAGGTQPPPARVKGKTPRRGIAKVGNATRAARLARRRSEQRGDFYSLILNTMPQPPIVEQYSPLLPPLPPS